MATKKKMLQAAAGNAGGADWKFLTNTYDASNNQVTFEQYDPYNGSDGSQTLTFDTKSLSAYVVSPASFNGQYRVVAERIDTSSSSKTHKIYLIDISGGIGSYSIESSFSFTSTYYPASVGISPNGKTLMMWMGFDRPTYFFDLTSGFSNASIIKQYNIYDFGYGPRGGTYTPIGYLQSSAASNESQSIYQDPSNLSSFTVWDQQWNVLNQGYRGYNYDGSLHFFWGNAVQTYHTPVIHEFPKNSATSSDTIGTTTSYIRPQGINPNEGVDGLSYILGYRMIQDGSGVWQWFAGTRVIDYVSETVVYEDTTSTTYPKGYMPDGRIVLTDNTVLDPTDSFADVTSEYDSDFVSNYNSVNDRSHWYKNGHPSLDPSGI
jgi:hypothetical protein